MVRKLLPLLLALVGLAVGVGSGYFLRADPDPKAEAEQGHSTEVNTENSDAATEIDPELLPEYVKLNNQFVVPILQDGKVISMVILTLSLEVSKGSTEQVYGREPKLRDAFLQVMFDHANAGGFRGAFTDGANLILLRKALLESAKSAVGDMVLDILISDIVRQDS